MLELRPVPVQDPDIHVPSRTSRSIGLGSRRISRLRDPKQSPNPPIGVSSQIPVIFAVFAKKRARFSVSLFGTWQADRESIMMRLLLDYCGPKMFILTTLIYSIVEPQSRPAR